MRALCRRGGHRSRRLLCGFTRVAGRGRDVPGSPQTGECELEDSRSPAFSLSEKRRAQASGCAGVGGEPTLEARGDVAGSPHGLG